MDHLVHFSVFLLFLKNIFQCLISDKNKTFSVLKQH